MSVLRASAGVVVLAMLATPASRAQERTTDEVTRPGVVRLPPTVHPPLPATPAQYWLVPDLAAPRPVRSRAATTAVANFVKAVGLVGDSQFAAALPLIDGAAIATTTPLGAYGYYYQGVAFNALQRFVEADAAFTSADALK